MYHAFHFQYKLDFKEMLISIFEIRLSLEESQHDLHSSYVLAVGLETPFVVGVETELRCLCPVFMSNPWVVLCCLAGGASSGESSGVPAKRLGVCERRPPRAFGEFRHNPGQQLSLHWIVSI